MGYTREEYINLINHSPLFSIDSETEPALYESEKFKFLTYLADYFKEFIYSEKHFSQIGLEFVLAAQDSLRGFDPEKSSDPSNPNFIPYFSRVLKNRVKKSLVKENAKGKRGGIVIPLEGLVNKVRRNADYLLSQGKDPYSDENVYKIATLCRCSAKKVRECYKILADTTSKQSDTKNSDGETISIFDFIDSGIYADEKLIAEENYGEMFRKVETIYNSLQNRETQRKLFSMWITKYLIEIFANESEELLQELSTKIYFSKEVAAYYQAERRAPGKSKIAEMCGVLPESASRTFRMFEEKIKIFERKT